MTAQNTFVDFTNLGDTGTSTAGSIQPLVFGEVASASNLGRAPENLRSRTEIVRDAAEDLFYYRDTNAARYLIDLSGGGLLSWEVGGAGRVNNTTALSLRPFVGPQTDVKGQLYVGTAASNQLRYTVAASAYAAEGMNAVTIEHRSVTGTATPVVTVSAGPIYHILVVFDSANSGHDASAVSALLSSAIAAVPALAGNLTITTSAVPATAILATSGRVPLNTRTHSGGLSGNATADLEEHTLTAGALGTFTTTSPLAEGDLLAIRYDYVVEPAYAGGGRAESNVARGTANVASNLFIAQEHPEWLPGCVPLCKVLHGRLVWVDGTILVSGASMTPGSTYTTYFDPSAFSGLPTQVVNGGIDTAASTVAAALTSADQRLSQSRYATWTVTDGTNSTGGHYNGAGAVNAAVAAATNGGDIFVRRGVYTSALPAITITSGGLKLRGETHDGTLTSRTRMTVASSTTVTADVTLESLAYLRTGAFTTTLARNVTLRDVALQAGALALSGTSYRARLDNVTMLDSISTGTHASSSLLLSTTYVHATNSRFTGPDPLSAGTQPAVMQDGTNVESLYENCTFTSTKTGCLPFAFGDDVGTSTFVNCTFTLSSSAGSYVIDFEGLSLGGTVKFIGCRFVNSTGFAVVRARPTTGTVIFENCTLHANGSPDGIAVGAQCVAVFAPLTAAKVLVKNCAATVTETDFTGILRPLVRIGGSETGACAGTLKVDGFDLTLAGAGTALPASACVLLQGNAKCLYEGVTVDVAGKRLPDVTNTLSDGGPGYAFVALGGTARLRMRNFALYNADAPLTTNIVTAIGGQLYLEDADLDGFEMSVVSSPSTNTYRCDPCVLLGGTLTHGVLYLFRNSTHFTADVTTGPGGQRGMLTHVELRNAVANAGGAYAVRLTGGVARNIYAHQVTFQSGSPGVFLLEDGTRANEVADCDISSPISGGGGFALAYGFPPQNNVWITRNRFRVATSAGPPLVIDTSGQGVHITDNSFTTAGASAASCTPNPLTGVATAALSVSNNTYDTTSIAPS